MMSPEDFVAKYEKNEIELLAEIKAEISSQLEIQSDPKKQRSSDSDFMEIPVGCYPRVSYLRILPEIKRWLEAWGWEYNKTLVDLQTDAHTIQIVFPKKPLDTL